MVFGDWSHDFLWLEAKLIASLQTRLFHLDNFFNSMTVASDPTNAIFYVYPCIAVFGTPSSSLPFELMLIGSLLTWTGIHLKWILRGDRPYWWVKEFNQSYPVMPTLHQTDVSCAANPGNPSSHMMVQAGVLLVLVKTMLSDRKDSTGNDSQSTAQTENSYLRKWGCWGFYHMHLLFIMMSRIYNSATFPHQCILGAVLGGYLANKIHVYWNSERKNKQKSWKILAYTTLPVIISVASYWIQKAFDIDPQRSVRLAFKWCYSPYEISVGTTPVYYVTCSCGCLFGLGVVCLLQRMAVRFFSCGKETNELSFNSLYVNKSGLFYICNAIGIFFSTILLFQLQSSIPTDSITIFYLHHFALNFAAPFLYFAFVPIMLKIVMEKLKTKKD